ncbi:hypothetical protein GCM10027440_10560 [Nocardiopsis coralliicola]
MRRVLAAAPDERRGLLRELHAPVAAQYRFAPEPPDLADVHGFGHGFPIDRDGDRCLAAVEVLEEADALGRMQRALDGAAAVLAEANPGFAVPDVAVLLVLGDPGDEHFLQTSLGMTAMGGISGAITITLWPTPENLERLEATAVHELHHNLRYSPGGVVWNPAAVTVGEQVVAEGLADAFARSLYGDRLGYARVGAAHLGDDAVYARVLEGLEVTGMENITAWVLGDAHARRYGGEPVGLPTGAGYSAGNRLVDAYLAASGRTAAQALHDDQARIIAAARG